MRCRIVQTLGAICFMFGHTTAAQADASVRVSPGDAWLAWSFDPLVLFTLVIAGWLYRRGWLELQRRTGTGRNAALWRAISFYTALALIGIILLSPLDAVSQELSSAHMAQHMLLMLLAAPLLVLGTPALVFAYAMPPLWRQLSGLQWLTHRLCWQPLVLWWVFAVTLWGWHHPTLYQAALRDPLVHDAQHLSFFAAAFLYWRVLLDPLSRRRLHPMAAIPYLFTTSIHASALGIFLTLAPAPWYPDYIERTAAFGLAPLADQQLAGLLMWAPGCLVYPIITVGLLARWLAGSASDGGFRVRQKPRGAEFTSIIQASLERQ